ncbi:hypothetical protein [Pseudomonas sp. O11]|uniref:hypothetical protein n=1 Tax=Pseudomonas sp. O11 TaxID=3159446 RepID=UPI00387AD59B
MSIDIIILKPIDQNATDLTAVESVIDIGRPEIVEVALNSVFPGCTDGAFVTGEEYSLEATLSGDPVSSIHLTLRYGSAWSEVSNNAFLVSISCLCQELKSQAFAVSDNSRISLKH